VYAGGSAQVFTVRRRVMWHFRADLLMLAPGTPMTLRELLVVLSVLVASVHCGSDQGREDQQIISRLDSSAPQERARALAQLRQRGSLSPESPGPWCAVSDMSPSLCRRAGRLRGQMPRDSSRREACCVRRNTIGLLSYDRNVRRYSALVAGELADRSLIPEIRSALRLQLSAVAASGGSPSRPDLSALRAIVDAWSRLDATDPVLYLLDSTFWGTPREARATNLALLMLRPNGPTCRDRDFDSNRCAELWRSEISPVSP
jgi:hypothetical protein